MTKSQAAALAAYQSNADLRSAKIRMGDALPDDGWLHDYLLAVTPLTDAPVEFHLVSGLSALSAALGNRLWAEEWGQFVFPHLWAVLVAPSSFWRKSTSINMAEAILRQSAPTALLPSDFSREKLLKILSEKPAGLLTIKEFGGFLGMLGRDYAGGLKENLTELYDGPDAYTRALQSGEITIVRPAITILAATTLDWLEAKISEGDLRGGFLGRFLFVTAAEKSTAKGLTGGMDYLARLRLVEGLHDVSEAAGGQIEYAPDVRELLDDWMHGWEEEVSATHHRSDLSGFAVRLQTYAVKLAMLYRASNTAGSDDEALTVIDERSARQAIAYCRVLWRNVAGLIDDDIAISRESKDLRRIRQIVGAGITRSDALRLSKMKARDFDQYLDTLIQGGEIEAVKVKSSEVGIDRLRDTTVSWLRPVDPKIARIGAAAVHRQAAESLGVPLDAESLQLAGIPSNSNGNHKDGEPEEPEDSLLSLSSLSTSTSLDTNTREETGRARTPRARARGTGNWITPSSESSADDPGDPIDELGPDPMDHL